MKYHIILITLLLSAIPKYFFSQDNIPNKESIKVFYFHTSRECNTCDAIENLTRTTLEENYPELMENKLVTFELYNIDEKNGKRKAEEMGVSIQSLLFTKGNKKIDLITDGYMFAYYKPERFIAKILETMEELTQ